MFNNAIILKVVLNYFVGCPWSHAENSANYMQSLNRIRLKQSVLEFDVNGDIEQRKIFW